MSETITLAYPIEVDGQTLTTITLRRPKTRDIRAMDARKGTPMDKTLWMLASLTGLTPEQIDEIDTADLNTLAEKIAGFTGAA